jgi:hypothetical protein
MIAKANATIECRMLRLMALPYRLWFVGMTESLLRSAKITGKLAEITRSPRHEHTHKHKER